MKQPRYSYNQFHRPAIVKHTQLRLPFAMQAKQRRNRAAFAHLDGVKQKTQLAPPQAGSVDDELLRDLNTFASSRKSP